MENRSITIQLRGIYFLAINRDSVSLCLISKRIKVRRYRSILCPSRNTNAQSELLFLFGINGNADFAIPRIGCDLFQFYIVSFRIQFGFTLDIKIDINIIALNSIHVKRYGSHETRYITRTASATKPLLAFMLPHRLKRIIIEKFIATE